MKRVTIFFCLVLCTSLQSFSRDVQCLSQGWSVKPITQNQKDSDYTDVSIPHTWNGDNFTGPDRQTMVYRRHLEIEGLERTRRFLYFEGVSTVCDVFVNYEFVGQHKGGYTAFCYDITTYLNEGDNLVELWVSNDFRSDVIPLIGDFNIYGGVHRPVHLITTPQECIAPDFFASPGVFVDQKNISAEKAEINIRTLVSAADYDKLAVAIRVESPSGDVVFEKIVPADATTEVAALIENPMLWNGKGAANLYQVTSTLLKNGEPVDRVSVTTGFRSIAAEYGRGFLLNGKPYRVYGVCRHEDVEGRGSALLPEDYDRDMALIEEIGATGLRLAHYPHAERIYDLADKYGICVWTEIPMCGPGGFRFAGYIDSPLLKENARQSVYELVYQKYNHPSVCFWGIFNELVWDDGKAFRDYGDPAPFVRELNDLFHRLDSSRLTTMAVCEEETHMKGCSDLIAWNKYFGWYDRHIEKTGEFYDRFHTNIFPQCGGVSEYGAGASIRHHVPSVSCNDSFTPNFHPEERQNVVHEANWAVFRECPWMWGTFIWNLADFGSYVKNEGDRPGINDKGLVTYDRSVRKDSFYFYKAEWTSEPMVYITSRRFSPRTEATTDVKVYSNQPKATLYVNGKKIGDACNDGMSRLVWHQVTLSPGDNEIRVVCGNGKKAVVDSCVWTLIR